MKTQFKWTQAYFLRTRSKGDKIADPALKTKLNALEEHFFFSFLVLLRFFFFHFCFAEAEANIVVWRENNTRSVASLGHIRLSDGKDDRMHNRLGLMGISEAQEVGEFSTHSFSSLSRRLESFTMCMWQRQWKPSHLSTARHHRSAATKTQRMPFGMQEIRFATKWLGL